MSDGTFSSQLHMLLGIEAGAGLGHKVRPLDQLANPDQRHAYFFFFFHIQFSTLEAWHIIGSNQDGTTPLSQ